MFIYRSHSWSEKIIHIIHCISYPEIFEDFDEGIKKVIKTAKLKKRYQDIKKERAMMAVIFFVENILLSLPVAYTGYLLTGFYTNLATRTTLLEVEKEALSTSR